jgi:hypothetical protein
MVFIGSVETLFLKKEGVTGILPLRCLPLWGREGVTLIIIEKI